MAKINVFHRINIKRPLAKEFDGIMEI